ncbi:MAG: hypothetical protein KKC79_16125 [Gammaproteobacteria bacterium]|nr:hypothetical protein [Gammaproteobacteria bacterium]MBU1439962.1 hypothetical protein [Gammaproteobacteria bacterium]MBU2410164.1 hypothetical protein [Gammaproteobacteria bacterium]
MNPTPPRDPALDDLPDEFSDDVPGDLPEEVDDIRIRQALAHAPDLNVAPDWRIRKAILDNAGAAVRAPTIHELDQEIGPWWQRLGLGGGRSRMPWNAAFATVLIAGIVTVLWQREPVPGARLDSESAVSSATSPAPSASVPPAQPSAPARDNSSDSAGRAQPPRESAAAAPGAASTPAPAPKTESASSRVASGSVATEAAPAAAATPKPRSEAAADEVPNMVLLPERLEAGKNNDRSNAPASPARSPQVAQSSPAAPAQVAPAAPPPPPAQQAPAPAPAPAPPRATAPRLELGAVDRPKAAETPRDLGRTESRNRSKEDEAAPTPDANRQRPPSVAALPAAPPAATSGGAAALVTPRAASPAAGSGSSAASARRTEAMDPPTFAALAQYTQATISRKGGLTRTLRRGELGSLGPLLGSAALSAASAKPMSGSPDWRISLERDGKVLAVFEVADGQVRWREDGSPAATGVPSASSLVALRKALIDAVYPDAASAPR